MTQKSNITKHVKDDADYVTLRTSGTKIPTSIKDVQQFAESIAPYSYASIGLPKATETTQGIARIATTDEVMNGLDRETIVTPATLKHRLDRPEATETVLGVVKLSTQEESDAGKVHNKVVTPLRLKTSFNKWHASESLQGTAKLSTLDQARVGTDDTTIMTPKKVAHAISVLSPVEGIATEKSKGVVTIATVGQVTTGVSREGLAVSPYSFKNTRATETVVGTTRFATQAEWDAGSPDVTASAKTIKSTYGSSIGHGFVKLSKTRVDQFATALDANADVVYNSGGNMTGRLHLNGQPYLTQADIKPESSVLVGMMIPSFIRPDISSGYCEADGRALSRWEYPEAFAVFGYRFGGSGDSFNIPDARGMFIRGSGKSVHINGELGAHVPWVGDAGAVQAQQVLRHHHIAPFSEVGVSPYGRVGGRVAGSGRMDWDNDQSLTSNGEQWGQWGTGNPDGTVGAENRPWNMSVYYLIKIK